MPTTNRIRTKPYTYRERILSASGTTASDTSFTDFKEYMVDNVGFPYRDNPCTHFTLLQGANGPWMKQTSSSSPTTRVWSGASRMTETRTYFSTFEARLLDSFLYIPLSFQQNNSFELLNFVAEIDDTIGIFATKFWREMTYGSINWGLLPLYSDLQSLFATFVDFQSGAFTRALNTFEQPTYRMWDLKDFDMDLSTSSVTCNCKFNGVLRLFGQAKLNLPDITAQRTSLLILLDELGVHPDLRTVWDLMPFSFILDYFLPIGDLLESLHPRGWFEPTFTFSGWYSLDGVFQMNTPVSVNQTRMPENWRSFRVYRRQSLSRTRIPTAKPLQVEYKAPTLRQLFNSSYIGGKLTLKDRWRF